jgi:hypothetical protein
MRTRVEDAEIGEWLAEALQLTILQALGSIQRDHAVGAEYMKCLVLIFRIFYHQLARDHFLGISLTPYFVGSDTTTLDT